MLQKIIDTAIAKDCPFLEAEKQGIEFTLENAKLFSRYALTDYFVKVYNYLQIVEQRLFSSGLHTLGTAPNQEELKGYLDAYFTDLSEREFQQILADEATNEKLKEGIAIQSQSIFGKQGYSIGHYAQVVRADLLVMNAPSQMTFWDRVFPHDIEHILGELPTDVLIVQ